ncbi:hypothetical protein J6590_062846 [Homalodisca vitripennis]|nr:hypothetical protein J6590_062846 [Homalodisca vitripennis]
MLFLCDNGQMQNYPDHWIGRRGSIEWPVSRLNIIKLFLWAKILIQNCQSGTTLSTTLVSADKKERLTLPSSDTSLESLNSEPADLEYVCCNFINKSDQRDTVIQCLVSSSRYVPRLHLGVDLCLAPGYSTVLLVSMASWSIRNRMSPYILLLVEEKSWAYHLGWAMFVRLSEYYATSNTAMIG